ncbi:MAG: hypothetical protein QNJ31_05970 [Candidatus Caenarcaniphilales bacterium]|nr:hypothetical protein [Candidatus Caenarcaniphilales bacterium]
MKIAVNSLNPNSLIPLSQRGSISSNLVPMNSNVQTRAFPVQIEKEESFWDKAKTFLLVGAGLLVTTILVSGGLAWKGHNEIDKFYRKHFNELVGKEGMGKVKDFAKIANSQITTKFLNDYVTCAFLGYPNEKPSYVALVRLDKNKKTKNISHTPNNPSSYIGFNKDGFASPTIVGKKGEKIKFEELGLSGIFHLNAEGDVRNASFNLGELIKAGWNSLIGNLNESDYLKLEKTRKN